MSSSDPTTGHVLLLCDDRPQSEKLARWIAGAGHEVVVLAGREKFLLNEGDDLRVNLVVTDLDPDDPSVRTLLDHLVGGDLFRAIPQLHVFRNLALMQTWRAANPLLAAYSIAAPPSAEDFQARVRLAAEVGRLQRDLAGHSTRDGLTALANRRYLLLRLGEEFSRARRYRTPLSLALIDIDRLKEVNDRHGQAAGDAVIRRVGELIRGQVRREDVMGRLGEDVFGVALPGNRYRGAGDAAVPSSRSARSRRRDGRRRRRLHADRESPATLPRKPIPDHRALGRPRGRRRQARTARGRPVHHEAVQREPPSERRARAAGRLPHVMVRGIESFV